MQESTDQLQDSIAGNLREVHARITEAETRFGREPGSVQLLAVSKVQGVEKIQAAHAAGQRDFGESYVQEALDKQTRLAALQICWHFIGRMQSNKTREIAESFDWVHGLCSLKHAHRLSEQRPENMTPLNCCVQVNLSGESSKAGLEPAALEAFVDATATLPGIRLRGLMTLPAPAEGLEAQRQPFAKLRVLRDRLRTEALPLETLSMGMSADLEAAIAEGATIVRIGTALFGARQQR